MKLPNELGVYDMSGNVDEWCHDCYIGKDNSEKECRVIRGGSFAETEYWCTVFVRAGADPKYDWDSRGFRLVLSDVPVPEEKEVFEEISDEPSEDVNTNEEDASSADPSDDPNINENDEAPPVSYAEEMPRFPGGSGSLKSFLKKEVTYPEVARKNGIVGTVLVEFVVEKDGRISNPQVIVPLFPDCDKEAVRVVKSMPKWKPGKNKGIPVRCSSRVAVSFKM